MQRQDSDSFEFNLYREIRKDYFQLIPGKDEGLVVFLIYQKIKLEILDKTFSHQTVIETIEEVSDDLGKIGKNNTPARNNEIIRNLLFFFLRRTKKGYVLKQYAYEFCKLIEHELENKFNPSQLEVTFRLFHNSLQQSLGSELEFDTWYVVGFEKNKNEIKKHLEILHNSVESIIQELNALYNSSEIDFTTKLKEMDLKVKDLINDTHRLESGLQLTDEIMSIINNAYQDLSGFAHSSVRFGEIRKEIRLFFEDIQQNLSDVSYSIDKIKPALKRLYGSLEQRELDRKLEKLLTYVFKNAELKKNETYRDEILLPEKIPLKLLQAEKDKFLHPQYYDYLNQKNLTVRKLVYDEEEHNLQFINAQKKVDLNRKAVSYYNEFMLTIKSSRTTDFKDLFFSLMDKEADLEIALKAAHLILKEVTTNKNYNLEIKKEFEFPTDQSNLAIWKTRVENLNS